MKSVRVFISYAWEDQAHRAWVKQLAATLANDGIEVRLDAWHQKPGQDFPSFMNAEVRLADRVLVVGSPQYRVKVHAYEEGEGTSGVGWEAMLVTSQIFSGNKHKLCVSLARGTRLLALPDFLLTQPAHDLSDPDDRRGYDELVMDLLGEPEAQLVRKSGRVPTYGSIAPLYEAHSQLDIALEFHEWVAVRWPEGHHDAIYPSWQDFQDKLVHFPDHILATLTGYLDNTGCALVTGASAAGKSVLGARIAYDWSRTTGRRSFWFDLGDHTSASFKEFRHDLRAIGDLGNASLIVFDNAQASRTLVDWAISYHSELQRRRPGHVRLLILSRPVGLTSEKQIDFEQRLTPVQLQLVASAKLFESTAKRLLRRLSSAIAWDERKYARWVREFGGDLIAFGQAVLAAGPTGQPDRRIVVTRMRREYIDPARRHPEGLAMLDRLSAASTLDLPLDENALGWQSENALKHLITAGHLQPMDTRRKRQWRLVHPGMGSLILQVRADEAEVEFGEYRRRILLEAVTTFPSLLGDVCSRLSHPSYVGAAELVSWIHSLRERPAVARAFMLVRPEKASTVDQVMPGCLPWSVISESDARARYVSAFKHRPLLPLIKFLQYGARFDERAIERIIKAILEDRGFLPSLKTRPLGQVVLFQRFVQSWDPQGAQAVLKAFLVDVNARRIWESGGPGVLVHFLRLVETLDVAVAAGILRERLQVPGVVRFLMNAGGYARVSFLAFAYEREPDLSQEALRSVLLDGSCVARIRNAAPVGLTEFLRFCEKRLPSETRELLTELLGDAEFIDVFSVHQLPELVALVRFSSSKAGAPNQEAISALLAPERLYALMTQSQPGVALALLRSLSKHDQVLADDLVGRLLACRVLVQWCTTSLSSAVVDLIAYCRTRPAGTSGAFVGEILSRSELQDTLHQVRPGVVASLLSNTADVAPVQTARLLREVAKDPDFVAGLALAARGRTIALLQHLAERFPSEVAMLVDALLSDHVVLTTMARSNSGVLVGVIGIARVLNPRLAADAVRLASHDEESCARLIQEGVAVFREFVALAEAVSPGEGARLVVRVLETGPLHERVMRLPPQEWAELIDVCCEVAGSVGFASVEAAVESSQYHGEVLQWPIEQALSVIELARRRVEGGACRLIGRLSANSSCTEALRRSDVRSVMQFVSYVDLCDPGGGWTLVSRLLGFGDFVEKGLRATAFVRNQFLDFVARHDMDGRNAYLDRLVRAAILCEEGRGKKLSVLADVLAYWASRIAGTHWGPGAGILNDRALLDTIRGASDMEQVQFIRKILKGDKELAIRLFESLYESEGVLLSVLGTLRAESLAILIGVAQALAPERALRAVEYIAADLEMIDRLARERPRQVVGLLRAMRRSDQQCAARVTEEVVGRGAFVGALMGGALEGLSTVLEVVFLCNPAAAGRACGAVFKSEEFCARLKSTNPEFALEIIVIFMDAVPDIASSVLSRVMADPGFRLRARESFSVEELQAVVPEEHWEALGLEGC